MFCKSCGKEIKDGAKFCKWCGARTEASPASAGSPNTMLAVFIVVGLILLFATIAIGPTMGQTLTGGAKTGWVAQNKFSFDSYKGKSHVVKMNDGSDLLMDCYKVSSHDIDMFWTSADTTFMKFNYYGLDHSVLDTKYEDVQDFKNDVRTLMNKYNVIVVNYEFDDGEGGLGDDLYIYAIKDGKVKEISIY